jgi:menaquinone-dependent protoporphyrinogen IX oxidase
MLMTTNKLLLLRLYNITLGRFAFFSRMLIKILVRILISRKRERKYFASSNFFDWKDIEIEVDQDQ